jgi:hypothetical protein
MIIVHQCHTCRHHDYRGWEHSDTADGAATADGSRQWPRQKCRQGCHHGQPCDWADPTPIVTYGDDYREEDKVYPPGQVWSSGLIVCGCAACRALYAEMTQ